MGNVLSFAPLLRGERCEKHGVKHQETNHKSQINPEIRNQQIRNVYTSHLNYEQ